MAELWIFLVYGKAFQVIMEWNKFRDLLISNEPLWKKNEMNNTTNFQQVSEIYGISQWLF